MRPVKVKVSVDSRTHFHIQGDRLWFDHSKGNFKRPAYKEGEVVLINDSEWDPDWKGNATDSYRLPTSYPRPRDPNRALSAIVTRLSGPGEATVVQQPRQENDYVTIVEITDAPRGSNSLEVEVAWKAIPYDEAQTDRRSFGGSTYRIVVAKGKTWEQARSMARDLGGDLSCIETREEFDFIASELERRRIPGSVAIGGIQSSPGRFAWITGESTDLSHAEWGLNENERYLFIAKFNKWTTWASDQKKTVAYVCEFGQSTTDSLPGSGGDSSPKTMPRTAPKNDSRMTKNRGDLGPEVPFQANQASVMALLIAPLGNSRYAGLSSMLSINALPVSPNGSSSTLNFNQDVGPLMESALEEVIRYHRLRHGGWPKNSEIELAFEEKYSPKGGPSAAVACSLLLESLFTGEELVRVLELAPNHLSARVLDLYADRNLPASLSLVGSLEEIDKLLGDLPSSAEADLSASGKLQLTEIGAIRSKLQRARRLLDPRTQSLADAWIEWTSTADQYLSGRMTGNLAVERLAQALARANAERTRLRNDPSIQEELLE